MVTVHPLDDCDRQILALLQENCRRTNLNIAEIVGLSPATVGTRIQRLETDGYIDGYHAVVNPEKLGFAIAAYITVKWEEGDRRSRIDSFEAFVKRTPWIVEAYLIAGQDGGLMKICAATLEELREMKIAICSGLGVHQPEINIVMQAVKTTSALPVSF